MNIHTPVTNSESHLDRLENEAALIINNVFASYERASITFSAGKDSICIAHIVGKLFSHNLTDQFPFELFHYDSGDNFPEVLKFRDDFAKSHRATLKVFKVKKDLNQDNLGGVFQITELINASVKEFNIQALLGGGRRDEDPVRAKERIFSIRDEDGKWKPEVQRAEPWRNYNLQLNSNEHVRVFPISNWTELDVWEYLAREKVELPSVYFAQERSVFNRNGIYLEYHDDVELKSGEVVENLSVRCRTIGDRSSTGFILSQARTIEQIVKEVRSSDYSERAGRAEDSNDQTRMEGRKLNGWF